MKIDLKKTQWTAGAAAFGCGVATHLFGLVTMLHNNDDIAQLPFGYGTGITSGRWFLTILGDLTGALELSYNLPLINGLLFLLLIALSAVVVTEVLQIRSRRFAALTGMLLAVFPSVAATMFFRYTVVYYGIALLLAVAAVWLTERHRLGFLGAIVCLALSMGIYQAYVPFTIGLFVLLLIRRTLQDEAEFGALVKRGVFYCLVLGLGVVVYFLCLKVCLALYGTQLSDYNGVNNMGKLSLAELPGLLKQTLYSFCMLPLKNYCGLANMRLIRLGWILLALTAGAAMVLCLIRKRCKLLLNAMAVVLCGLFPVAVNFIQIMCPGGWVYTLMVYPIALVPLLPVLAVEELPEGKSERLLGGVLAVLLAIQVFCYGYDTNVNYTSMYYANRQTENYLNNMLVQIRMTEGYDSDKKWAFIGSIRDPQFRSPWQYESLYGGNETAQLLVNRESRWYWFQMYCGYSIPTASQEETDSLAKLEEVRQMPCWPAAGSVKVIGDTVVIKCENME